MVLVFDLDDTLYEELTFVRSGFRAVASFLSEDLGLPAETVYSTMMEKLTRGRGRIFDDVLLEHGHFSRRLVYRCLMVYRRHKPSIALYPEANDCLKRFFDYPLYIVTDGNTLVQKKKLEALCICERVRKCFITHRHGLKHAKPSPYCFLRILQLEQVESHQVVYIADNPKKDFIGIKPLGFRTIRVLTGQHRSVEMPGEYEAEIRISSLREFDLRLLQEYERK